jgi:hypothetical protein
MTGEDERNGRFVTLPQDRIAGIKPMDPARDGKRASGIGAAMRKGVVDRGRQGGCRS